MATPLRKKRNFRDLQLPTSPSADVDVDPVPVRIAPMGPRKRPPPLDENAGPSTNFLAAPSALSPPRSTMQASLTSTLASLDMNAEHKKFDLKNDDFKNLQELGQGNGGSVMKVEHVPTGTVMAKKVCRSSGIS